MTLANGTRVAGRGPSGRRDRRGLRCALTTDYSRRTRCNLYDGISLDELALAPILATRTLVETEPNYAYVSARLLLDKLRREALSFIAGRSEQATQAADMASRYAQYFPDYLATGIRHELIDPELARLDVARIAAAITPIGII